MNFFDGMRAFTRVVEAGGFAAAALDLGLARSVVHKHVLKLEHTLGTLQLAPLIGEFMGRYPDVHVGLVLNDRFVDPIEEGFDFSIPINSAPCSRRMLRCHCR